MHLLTVVTINEKLFLPVLWRRKKIERIGGTAPHQQAHLIRVKVKVAILSFGWKER
jgi:hypothetical protein